MEADPWFSGISVNMGCWLVVCVCLMPLHGQSIKCANHGWYPRIRDLNENEFSGGTVYRCGARAEGVTRGRPVWRDSQQQQQFPAPGLKDGQSHSLAKGAQAGDVAGDTQRHSPNRGLVGVGGGKYPDLASLSSDPHVSCQYFPYLSRN